MDLSSRTSSNSARLLLPRLSPPLAHQGLESLVGLIDECIAIVTAARLHETAELLRVARLDLVARLNGISDEELEQLASALQMTE